MKLSAVVRPPARSKVFGPAMPLLNGVGRLEA